MSEATPPRHDELAAVLAALRPQPAHLERDALMFQAGRTAGAARCRRWRWATGLASTAVLCLSVALLVRPEPTPSVRIVYLPTPPPPAALPTPVEPPSVEEPSTAPPGSFAWRLEQALWQAGAEGRPPDTAEPDEDAPPVRGHAVSTWEWRRDVILHPSLLEEGN